MVVMSRDVDRRQVYAAEDLSAQHTVLAMPQPIRYLQDTANRLVASQWWTTNFGSDAVTVVPNRSSQRSFYSPDRRLISLSLRSVDLSTLCHELAHAAAFDRGLNGAIHGPRFRSLNVSVHAAMLGHVSAEDLLDVYHQFGLATANLQDVSDAPAVPVLDRSLYERTEVRGQPATRSGSSLSTGSIAL